MVFKCCHTNTYIGAYANSDWTLANCYKTYTHIFMTQARTHARTHTHKHPVHESKQYQNIIIPATIIIIYVIYIYIYIYIYTHTHTEVCNMTYRTLAAGKGPTDPFTKERSLAGEMTMLIPAGSL